MVRNISVDSSNDKPPTPPQSQTPPPGQAPEYTLEPNVDLWVKEQMFEEDVRAVLKMMRPHGRERLSGWKEYRTGGAHFRVTVSWDDEFEITAPTDTALAVPHMTDVLETLLVGSARNADEINVTEEFAAYRKVVRDLYHRLEHQQSCYE
jgi:hypothetical protein